MFTSEPHAGARLNDPHYGTMELGRVVSNKAKMKKFADELMKAILSEPAQLFIVGSTPMESRDVEHLQWSDIKGDKRIADAVINQDHDLRDNLLCEIEMQFDGYPVVTFDANEYNRILIESWNNSLVNVTHCAKVDANVPQVTTSAADYWDSVVRERKRNINRYREEHVLPDTVGAARAWLGLDAGQDHSKGTLVFRRPPLDQR